MRYFFACVWKRVCGEEPRHSFTGDLRATSRRKDALMVHRSRAEPYKLTGRTLIVSINNPGD